MVELRLGRQIRPSAIFAYEDRHVSDPQPAGWLTSAKPRRAPFTSGLKPSNFIRGGGGSVFGRPQVAAQRASDRLARSWQILGDVVDRGRRETVTADCAKDIRIDAGVTLEPEIKPLAKSVAPIELVKKLENDTGA